MIEGFYFASPAFESVVPDDNLGQEKLVSIGEDPPSMTVVQTVADAGETGPSDLPPLYDAVDPDALDAMIQGRNTESVVFDYCDYTVAVQENHLVTIRK